MLTETIPSANQQFFESDPKLAEKFLENIHAKQMWIDFHAGAQWFGIVFQRFAVGDTKKHVIPAYNFLRAGFAGAARKKKPQKAQLERNLM